MLVYLNGLTWTHSPEALAVDLQEAFRLGVHLHPCHEFPSVLDSGSDRAALEFKAIMDATPPHLKKSPTNVYSQIAIALKGGELREVGLHLLAARLAERVRCAPIPDEALASGRATRQSHQRLTLRVARSRSALSGSARSLTLALQRSRSRVTLGEEAREGTPVQGDIAAEPQPRQSTSGDQTPVAIALHHSHSVLDLVLHKSRSALDLVLQRSMSRLDVALPVARGSAWGDEEGQQATEMETVVRGLGRTTRNLAEADASSLC